MLTIMQNVGIDNGWWATVLTVDNFIKTYGQKNEKTGKYSIPSSWLSAGSGTANAGMTVGAAVAGPIIAKIGRKWSTVVIVIIGLIGMVIQNAVPNYWGVMAGRTINAISMVCFLNRKHLLTPRAHFHNRESK